MGGHQSKQTVGVSTNVAANIVQNTAQNCISVAYGGNTININGNYNNVSGVDQTVSISINSDCSTFAQQNSTFDADLQNALTQALNDQEVALTEWMDNSRDDQSASVSNSVTANFTQNTVQNCVNTLNGYNILNVTGTGNVVKDITQNATLNVISQCLLGNGQTSSVVSDITNTVNQQSTYVSQNPLAFIADAIAAIFKSLIVAAAVVFVVIICFVMLFLLLRGKKQPSASGSQVIIETGGPGLGPGAGYGSPGYSGF